MTTVDIYPVGLLKDLKRFRGDWWCQGRRVAVRHLANSVRRQWRDRNYWNGYLAEPTSSTAPFTRAGHGWTKARARLDLARHVADLERSRRPGAGT